MEGPGTGKFDPPSPANVLGGWVEMKIMKPLLRCRPASRWSYEGFFLNEKKEVMRDEAMFEMWGGVPGGQAGAATPDGDGGSQGREQKGQETVVVR